MATRSQIATPSSSSSSNLPSKLESLTLEETNNNNSNFAPWLQLPDFLTEEILERLPISDYVRFGAVCPQWLSIQQNHRCRHAPSPPPMLNLPWFIPCEPQQEPVDCFSPFEQRSHRLRLPLSRRYLERGIESEGRSWNSYQPNGWLVLDDVRRYGSYYFTLLNPITGVQIELPREGDGLYLGCKLTVSPPPGRLLVFLMAFDKWNTEICLFREGDDYWSELEFPDNENMQSDASLDETCSIVWEGKVYYMYLGRGLMVIDPLPSDPTIEFLEMDQSQLPALRCGWEGDVFHAMELFMVESNGKMLLVVEFFESTCIADKVVVGFQVFEADFSNKRWVRLESLGDRVLFIHRKFVCSMLADDIGVEGNCVYCLDPYKVEESYRQNSSRAGPMPWSVFSLGTGKLTESLLSHVPTPSTHRMFVPRLC